MQVSLGHFAVERWRGPCLRVPDRDDVDVAVEHERGAVSLSRQPSDESPRFAAVDLDSGEVRIGKHVGEIDLPEISVEAALAHQRRHMVLGLVLGVCSAHAGDTDKRGNGADHCFGHLIDRFEHSSLRVAYVRVACLRAHLVTFPSRRLFGLNLAQVAASVNTARVLRRRYRRKG